MNAPIVLEHPEHSQQLTVHPSAGCVATSWRAGGHECLALPDALPAFLASTRTGGIPLLYPYANRLSADRFDAAGRSIDLTRVADLKRDAQGLPIHGLLLRWPHWSLERSSQSELRARLRWGEHAELLSAFPFPHTLVVSWRLGADGLNALLDVEVQVHADSDCDVPISFGWHPYLAVSASTRSMNGTHIAAGSPVRSGADGEALPCIDLPAARHWVLRADGLPTGEAAAELSMPRSESVGAGQDALLELPAGSAGVAATVRCAEWTTEIDLRSGWRFLQIYSPRGAAFAAIEPMTTATNALVTGAPVVRAGSVFTAAFTLKHR